VKCGYPEIDANAIPSTTSVLSKTASTKAMMMARFTIHVPQIDFYL
jgi:hypothetical protein